MHIRPSGELRRRSRRLVGMSSPSLRIVLRVCGEAASLLGAPAMQPQVTLRIESFKAIEVKSLSPTATSWKFETPPKLGEGFVRTQQPFHNQITMRLQRAITFPAAARYPTPRNGPYNTDR